MNQLIDIAQTQELKMSSREIAELCDKRHDNVCRDIKKLNEHYGSMGLLKIENTPWINEQNGQEYQQFRLTKEQCLDLVTGYNTPLRIRINRRWLELEAKEIPVITGKKDTLLINIVKAEKEVDRALALNKYETEWVKPLEEDSEILTALTDTSGLFDFGEVAKVLGLANMGRNNLMKWARDKGILMKDNSPYQRYVLNGWIKPVEFYSQKNNTDYYTIYVRPMLTQRGIVRIGKLLMKDGYKVNVSAKR